VLAALAALLVVVAAPAHAVAQVISAADAAAHVGQEVTVEGDVPTVVCSPLACLLSFTADYSGLVASIPGDAQRAFPPPKETYAMHRVRVHGVVVDKNGRPRIEVRDPADLQVIDGGGGRAPIVVNVPLSSDDGADAGGAPAAAAPASPGGETILAEQSARAAPPPPVADVPLPADVPRRRASRVIDPGQITTHVAGQREPDERPRGESIVARLSGDAGGDAATVEASALRQEIAKLEEQNAALRDAVAALDQRLTALERGQSARFAGVGAVPMPETHDYVVSTDDSNHLQRVTRGWSAERLLRAFGPPLNTVTEANGVMTWYYSNGRAVTLDARGRVVSSIGF
jgi:hypothetical protein